MSPEWCVNLNYDAGEMEILAYTLLVPPLIISYLTMISLTITIMVFGTPPDTHKIVCPIIFALIMATMAFPSGPLPQIISSSIIRARTINMAFLCT